MTRFSFKARGRSGEVVASTRDAGDRYELARTLRAEGLLVVSAEEVSQESDSNSQGLHFAFSFLFLKDLFGHVGLAEKIIFSKNLGVMIGAGMSLTRALDALARETHNKKFKTVIADIVEQLKEGHTFAESLTRHPKIFSPIYISMVEAGEKSGKLQGSLAILATQMQADYDLIRKVRGAMMYPGIILIAMILIGILMMIYVVPTLTSVFKELNVELPATTRFVITLSDLILNRGLYVLGGAILFAAAFYTAIKSTTGKNILDALFVKTPLIGPLVKKFNAARTARTLSSLISAGVAILEALEITAKVLQNHFYSTVLEEAKSEVQKGEPISKVFTRREDLYPSLMAEMLSVGEETGQTSKMLEDVAVFYEGQVADATRDLSTIVEPVLMIFIGAVVGFFAVSMITPMYSLSNAI